MQFNQQLKFTSNFFFQMKEEASSPNAISCQQNSIILSKSKPEKNAIAEKESWKLLTSKIMQKLYQMINDFIEWKLTEFFITYFELWTFE